MTAGAVRAFRPIHAALWMALALLCLTAPLAQARAQDASPEINFRGRLLVIASDGDMQAQAYAGDRLGPPLPDTLSVVRLDGVGQPSLAGSVAVPNSVVGPPASLTVSPDGRYAIVVETRGQHPPGSSDARLKDLPAGRAITVVDLHDAERPLVVQRIAGRDNPLSVSVSPDGTLVAIAYDSSSSNGAPLDLYDFSGGRLSGARSPAIPGFAAGEAIKNVAFAPGGALALVYMTHPRLSFVRVAGKDRLIRWGDDVGLGRTPFEVRFTPDGRFALVNDMFVPPEGADVRGTITSIAIADGLAPDGSPRHHVVSTARTGVLPEGLAVSPDGRWVATTNLERTAYAANDPRQGFFASVTLVRLDPGTGRLERVGESLFAGVIPEALAFDGTSRFLATVSFDHIGPQAGKASLDFWRLATDFQDRSRVELAPTGLSIPIARGAQSMEIVR